MIEHLRLYQEQLDGDEFAVVGMLSELIDRFQNLEFANDATDNMSTIRANVKELKKWHELSY
jgi:hypothetical protein